VDAVTSPILGNQVQFGATDFYSHANQSCVDSGVRILYIWPNRTVGVTPCLASFGTIKQAQIVSAGIAYGDPEGNTHLLLIHQVIHFLDLEHNLFCPMQV
jgi:hypothetical protein